MALLPDFHFSLGAFGMFEYHFRSLTTFLDGLQGQPSGNHVFCWFCAADAQASTAVGLDL